MDRASLLNREPGGVAVAVAFQTSSVIPLMLGVSQCFGFGSAQAGIVTGFLTILASRKVTLVFGVGCPFRLQRGEFRVVALIPTIGAILSVAPECCGGRVPGLRRSQLGMLSSRR